MQQASKQMINMVSKQRGILYPSTYGRLAAMSSSQS